jgi:hypothetical protein
MKRYDSGPWRVEQRGGGVVRIGTPSCPAMVMVGGRGGEHARHNGARIVAVLNACEGIPTAELERMAAEWKAREIVTCIQPKAGQAVSA